MTADDLRTRAEQAAYEQCANDEQGDAFIDGALWHAAQQQPSREQIARAIHADDLLRDGGDSWDDQDPHLRDWYLNNADAVLALVQGGQDL